MISYILAENGNAVDFSTKLIPCIKEESEGVPPKKHMELLELGQEIYYTQCNGSNHTFNF